MVFPLYEENSFKLSPLPWVTWTLIAINVMVSIYLAGSPSSDQTTFVSAFALIPANMQPDLPSYKMLLSYMFVHIEWSHLLGNMLLLYIFGGGTEAKLGQIRFLSLYLASGMLGGLAFVLAQPSSMIQLIGASGAIAGIMATFLMIKPCANIAVLAFGRILQVRTYWFTGTWLLVQIFYWTTNRQDGISYVSHVGGAMAGAALLLAIRPKNVMLFECKDTKRDQVLSAIVSTIPIVAVLLGLTALLLLMR